MTASGCWLPASAIETVCRDVIADIDNKRRRYVDDAIAPLLEDFDYIAYKWTSE